MPEFAGYKLKTVKDKFKVKNLLLLCVTMCLLISAVNLGIYVYWNTPVRSILAAIKYEEYRQYQGIAAALVAQKKIDIDYKTGNVYVVVRYKDDPHLDYHYLYRLCLPDHLSNTRWQQFHRMSLSIITAADASDIDNEYSTGARHRDLGAIWK